MQSINKFTIHLKLTFNPKTINPCIPLLCVNITINRKRINISDSTAELLLKYKDTIDQMVNFWDKHMTYMEKNKKNLHRPRVVDLVAEAMKIIDSTEIKSSTEHYPDMPIRCTKYFEEIKKQWRGSYRVRRALRYGNPMARYCIEAYVSKQLDKMTEAKQIKQGKQIIKIGDREYKDGIRYTKNKYKLTRGTAYNARKKLGW